MTRGGGGNQEGGFAPNCTPTCLTAGQSGFILDAAVINEVNEHPEALPAVDRATTMCGESPANFLADGGPATGPIMAGLEQREITGFVPVKSNEPAADSPVRRDDLTLPVAEGQWSKLPRNPQGQLDKGARNINSVERFPIFLPDLLIFVAKGFCWLC